MPLRPTNALRAAVAIVCLAAFAAIVFFGWNQIQDASSLHRHWVVSWLIAALLSQLLVYCCIAAMFKLSLRSQNRKLSFFFLVYCALAFLFANRALPGPAVAGVATLIFLLHRKNITSVDAQAAATSFYFADYAGFITLIASVSVPLIFEQPSHTARAIYIASLCAIALAAGASLWLFSKPKLIISLVTKAALFFRQKLHINPQSGDWSDGAGKSIMDLHGKIVSAAKSPATLALYFLLSVAMHIAEVATVLCGAHAAGIALSAPVAAASYVAGNLASIVSVLPGAVGFYEAGMVGTLHLAGHLTVGDSAVCAITYRLLSFWAPLPVVANVLLDVSRKGLMQSSTAKPIK